MKIIERIKQYMENPAGNRPVSIGFLGDSVTQGCFEMYRTGDDSFETEYRSSQAYHNKLKLMLEEVYPSVPFQIINAGVSGDNAVSGSRRVERDVISFQPDMAVVCYGLNDANEGAERLTQFAGALEEIFQKLAVAGIEVIFMTPNSMADRVAEEIRDPYLYAVIDRMSMHQRGGNMDLYMEKAREICVACHVPVCDCYAKWKKLAENGVNTTRLLANRINHPSEAMHWLFAFSLFEMIMGMHSSGQAAKLEMDPCFRNSII